MSSLKAEVRRVVAAIAAVVALIGWPGNAFAEGTKTDKTNSGADVVGSWRIAAILNEDGSTMELRHKQSSFEFGSDGKYNQNIWVGNNLQGHGGTYKISGNQLTLDWSGKKEVYTMTPGANGTLTLKEASGSGWRLERAK
jgi:hypothetical protein